MISSSKQRQVNKKNYTFSDNVRIDGAEFKDGLLSIHLYKEEPKKETPSP